MTEEKALRIASVIAHPGWNDVLELLEDQRKESQEFVFHLMDSNPDKLTGKTAIRHAARAKSLLDFKESIYDSLKILAPQPKGGRKD